MKNEFEIISKIFKQVINNRSLYSFQAQMKQRRQKSASHKENYGIALSRAVVIITLDLQEPPVRV